MKGIVVIILGLVALGVAGAATWKWYQKYKTQKSKTGETNNEEESK